MDIEVKTEPIPILASLSLAQQRVLGRLVFFGETNLEIAMALHLSEKTVKAHVTAIYKITGCKHCRQLLVRYFRGALVPMDKDTSDLGNLTMGTEI